MALHKLNFTGAFGTRLAARLELPDHRQVHAFALFAHCFTCTKNLTAISNISSILAAHGIGVLRFDFTGLGESEGDFADTNFSSNVADLLAAAAFLEQQYAAPSLLIGHSLGGAAVLQAAASLPAVRALVTIGAPASPAHVKHLISEHEAEIEQRGAATVTLAGRSFTITRQFLDDLEQNRMQQTLRTLRRALLILHAPLDTVVGIENAAQIYQAARHPKSFISLDGADHLLSNPQDSRYAGSMIAAWAERYLPAEAPASLPAGLVRVQAGRSHYTNVISAGTHRLLADEPHSAGGADLGPNPYDLLLAALGACTSMTLRMYADRKNWPLESIEVQLRHRRVHAADCADCETREGLVDCIDREISVSGDLDETQRMRLHEIADRCPVHRTLHNQIKVRTSLKLEE